MKRSILIIFAAVFILTIEFLLGYKIGTDAGQKSARKEANQRAIKMILNDEIPNYYLVIETVDFLINNNSGELQNELKEKLHTEIK